MGGFLLCSYQKRRRFFDYRGIYQVKRKVQAYAICNHLHGDSEFLKAVDGRKSDKVWKLIDELVEAVKILHPRMYTTFIDKVQDL